MEQNSVQFNAVKKASRVIKQWSSPEKILFTVATLQSDTEITEEFTDYILQGNLLLSSDTLKDALFHLVGKISNFP